MHKQNIPYVCMYVYIYICIYIYIYIYIVCVCVCVCVCILIYVCNEICYKIHTYNFYKGEMQLLVSCVFSFISPIEELLHEISLVEIVGSTYVFFEYYCMMVYIHLIK